MELFMRKSVSRTLYLLAILCAIAAVVLIFLGLQGSTVVTSQTNYSVSATVTSIGHPALFFAGVAAAILGGILAFISWIGALVMTAKLGRWGWFVCLLLLSGITLLIYIFAGPTTSANQPVYAGQYPPQPYPPQYPRQ
jgi:hypothetical protein